MEMKLSLSSWAKFVHSWSIRRKVYIDIWIGECSHVLHFSRICILLFKCCRLYSLIQITSVQVQIFYIQ
jgi:hypothetical protein